MPGRPYKCPHCQSTNTTWKGHRKLKNGRARIRKCKQCSRKFTTKRILATEPSYRGNDA